MENVEFEWLADLSKWQCFTTGELSRPAKSLDFGAEGFTASLTDWHELLQLTRPDATCGIVFVRGRFPNSPGSILARAQRRDDSGSKDTFGTQLLPPDPAFPDVELGERKIQGWVNFRWPYTQYEIVRKDPETGDVLGTGTCECISFVRNGTVFQITRLKWGHGSSLSDYDTSVTQGSATTARFRVGGTVRFGCPCSNQGPMEADSFTIKSVTDSESGPRLCCTSDNYQTRLEIQLFENGIPKALSTCQSTTSGLQGQKWVNISSERRIDLPVGDPVYLVSTYTLLDATEAPSNVLRSIFDDLEDYLGISRESINMTDRLWTALCAANYEAVEAVEFCIVGRCVEQILGVTSIPITVSWDQEPGDHRGPPQILPETALIANIMNNQYVDVQSAFFQIRLLAKIHDFVSTRRLEPDFLQTYRALEEIRSNYLVKLRKSISSTLAWLFATDLKPGRLLLAVSSELDPDEDSPQGSAFGKRLKMCADKRGKLTWDGSYNRGCYATMAAWYVMKRCPEAITESFVDNIVAPKIQLAFRLGLDRAHRDKQPTAKSNVLQWLHFSCLLLICDSLGWEENELLQQASTSDMKLDEVIETQQRFEKHVSRLKTSHADGWLTEYEELDRVLMLAEEMGLEKLRSRTSHSLAISRARQTRKRIQDRRRTTTFNPGPKPWMTARSLSNGPWELLCTNHEAFLRVADDASVIPARDRLFEFLLSDYSFMSSWDRADANMVGRWWDVQPVAIICATLLDLKLEGKLQSAKAYDDIGDRGDVSEDPMVQSTPNVRVETTALLAGQDATPWNDTIQAGLIRALVKQLKLSQDESNQAQLNLLRQLSGQGDGGIMGSVKAFDWMTHKPSMDFYPHWWLQSLDDTPEAFQNSNRRNVDIRANLKHYLGQHEGLHIANDPAYTLSTVASQIRPEDLRLLEIFDIFHGANFTFTVKSRNCRPEDAGESKSVSSGSAEHTRSPDPTEGRDPGTNRSPSRPYEGMLDTLNDSLVDIGPKHRVIFVQKCSPALVGGHIYMWHPDALDTIDDHFGAVSRFTESRESTMWTTSITISHWTTNDTHVHNADRFRELHRQNGDFPPDSIALLGSPLGSKHTVQEQSSSLVITGDASGYLWICSLWSPVTDSASLSPSINNALVKVLNKFIHQQASGRCLSFLILLGHLCEKLASEYGEVLSRLDEIMEIGDRVLLEGLEDWWGTKEAVARLKKMLWGLEALRVFNDKISSSLSQIQRAHEAMQHTIKLDAAQQHIDLAQEYNNIVEEFKKRYGMLADVQDKTQLKIRQVTGLRDGISTVTNVVDNQTALEDSKTTIKQGNNIRALTYITIAYLPLGFITGLFSIQHATFMDNATNISFAILIVLFSLGTYFLAFNLERALLKFRRPKWPALARRKRLGEGDEEAISLASLSPRK